LGMRMGYCRRVGMRVGCSRRVGMAWVARSAAVPHVMHGRLRGAGSCGCGGSRGGGIHAVVMVVVACRLRCAVGREQRVRWARRAGCGVACSAERLL
jgi:hypothetical protein